MSADITVERETAASPESLWALISDVTRMGEWSPETVSARWLGKATGPEVGARFRGRNQHGRKQWSSTCVVTVCEPGQRFEFDAHALGSAYATWTYEIEPRDGGSTIRESWTDRRNWLIRRLGKPVSGVSDRMTHNRVTMIETLERLAAAAEP